VGGALEENPSIRQLTIADSWTSGRMAGRSYTDRCRQEENTRTVTELDEFRQRRNEVNLPGEHVRVMGPAERLLQLVQLVAGERRPVPALFPLVTATGGRRAAVTVVLVVYRRVVSAAAHIHYPVRGIVVIVAARFIAVIVSVIVVHNAHVDEVRLRWRR